MGYKSEYDELYATLNMTQRQKFNTAFNQVIAPVVDQVSAEEKYRLSLYLLRRMLKAGRRKK